VRKLSSIEETGLSEAQLQERSVCERWELFLHTELNSPLFKLLCKIAHGERQKPLRACQTCGDVGWVTYDVDHRHPDFGKAVPCPDCDRAYGGSKQTAFLARSGIGPSLQEKTLLNFEANAGNQKALELVREWAEGGHVIVVLIYGRRGNGKTHLAVGAALRCVELGGAVRFVRAPDLISELKLAGIEEAERVMAGYKKVETLIIDDLWAEYVTDWTNAKLEDLICCRIDNYAHTLITTNADPLTLSEINALPRAMSRLRREEYCEVVHNKAGEWKPARR